MRFTFVLLVLFLSIELMVLIKVGSLIGVLPTVALVLCTTSLGGYLLRKQGLSALFRARERMANAQMPVREMLEGIVIATCGFLLLIPGFITDILALVGALPATRCRIVDHMLANQQWHTQAEFSESDVASGPFMQETAGQKPEVIEGEFHREE